MRTKVGNAHLSSIFIKNNQNNLIADNTNFFVITMIYEKYHFILLDIFSYAVFFLNDKKLFFFMRVHTLNIPKERNKK